MPKARPRTVTKNGKTVTYTPEPVTRYENWVRLCAKEAMRGRDQWMEVMQGPLRLEVTFYLRRPASRAKKHRYPDRRPDVENLVKSVMDALTGILWADDAQVVTLNAQKRYGDPRAEITVYREEVDHVDKRICPTCGAVWYSAAAEQDWNCGLCGTRLPKSSTIPVSGKEKSGLLERPSRRDQPPVRFSNI